nr:hypothetical protein [uncultured Pseudoxanthomonas sp.]
MEMNLHLILLSSAIFLLLTGWVWLLRNAFRTHVLWGFAGLFTPPALILFGLLHLRGSRTALLTYVAGMIVLGIGLTRPITVNLPTAPYSLPS